MDRWDDFRGPLDLGNWHNIERRIGARIPADGIAVRLVLDDEIDLRDSGFVGRLIEVSVTGGAIEAPSDIPVEVPGSLKVCFGDSESTVTVRHATPSVVAGLTHYGVEWGRLEEPFRSVVYGVVAEARPVGVNR
jgi:hypothetical protein